MRMISGLIICGFPGVGKTAAHKIYNDVFDVESTYFRYKTDEFGRRIKEERENWVSNYVDYIERQASRPGCHFVLVTSHEQVRKEMDERRIPYIMVVPHKELRDEYLIRYIKRGDAYSFIERIYNHWNEWLDEIEISGKPVIHLSALQTLSDILPSKVSSMG